MEVPSPTSSKGCKNNPGPNPPRQHGCPASRAKSTYFCQVSRVDPYSGEAGTTGYVIGNGSNGAGANQIVSATGPGGDYAYTYDANGNRKTTAIGEAADGYGYDYENRLTSLNYQTGESGTGEYGYGYDYRTRRVQRQEPGSTTATSVVYTGGVSAEEYTSAASSPVVEYVRGHDYGGGVGGLEYGVRSGTPAYNHYNSRGDVVTQTDASGSVDYAANYDAFGTILTQEGSDEDRQRANTKEQDPTGLINDGFRYRDPVTGTFITRDPAGFIDGPNLYTYVHQNPWTKFDPQGLEAFPADVMKHVNAVGASLTLPASNIVGRMAAMKMVGEENFADAQKGKFMKFIHKVYDLGARTGVTFADPANIGSPGHNPISGPVFPERWQTGNVLEKGLSNLDPLMHDIGPGNIKPKTAAEATGTSTTWGLAMVAKALTTDAGTAGVASRLVTNAQKDLNPFVSAKSTREQAQIITDYLREGSQHYWEEVGKIRGMTPDQVAQWRQHPDSFRMPDGSKPKALAPNHPIDKAQMQQVEASEKKTRPQN